MNSYTIYTSKTHRAFGHCTDILGCLHFWVAFIIVIAFTLRVIFIFGVVFMLGEASIFWVIFTLNVLNLLGRFALILSLNLCA